MAACPHVLFARSRAGCRTPTTTHVLDDLLRVQDGVLTRAQALASGMTDERIEANLVANRWQRLFAGVYACFSGPLPRRARLWAAVLRAGEEAVLSHETAAELVGLIESPSARIHVTVPWRRTVHRIPGVMVHRSVRASLIRHPSRIPPQTRVEETVIDLTQTARCVDDAMGWLARAVGARITTADRLTQAMRRRSRLRWRGTLRAALDDVRWGCHSLLEIKYFRNVERAHGIPMADRQAVRQRAGHKEFDDVRYRQYRTRVELDGRVAHPYPERFRDMRRDNSAVAEGDDPLRYGIRDVEEFPCHVAAQVGGVLRHNGWTGSPHACNRPDCVISLHAG